MEEQLPIFQKIGVNFQGESSSSGLVIWKPPKKKIILGECLLSCDMRHALQQPATLCNSLQQPTTTYNNLKHQTATHLCV